MGMNRKILRGGFEKVSEDANGNTMWELDVRKYVRREVHIEV
jgi:hypothetical protein